MQEEMHRKIINKLDEVEQLEHVRILLAIESGSRAWGFASPDSDYDVRFIYVREPEEYLRLDRVRDVIEWQLDEIYDINGWDVSKALRLLHSSNPTLFEWSKSPIVYRRTDEYDEIERILPIYFDSRKELYHYWHMADLMYRRYLQSEDVQIKKYFYVLRPMLAANWVIRQSTPPPILFSDLLDAECPPQIRPEIERLLDLKKNTPELGMVPKIATLDHYIEETLPTYRDIAAHMESKTFGWKDLNEAFRKLVRLA